MRNQQVFTLILLCSSLSFFAQSQDRFDDYFTENTADSTKFGVYLDTIKYYTYVDNQIVKEHFEKCEALLSKGVKLSNKKKVNYAIYRVYSELGQENVLESFQILKNSKHLLGSDDISVKEKNLIKYLEGYTQMILGDFEFAQIAYYELLEYGRQNNDTTSMTQALYSLGQLFAMQEDYKNAEKYYLEEFAIENAEFKKNGLHSMVLLELVNLYIETKQFDKAERYNKLALQIVDDYKIKDLKVDFLRFKGEIALSKNDIKTAQLAYKEAAQLAVEIQDNSSLKYCHTLKAKILNARGFHKKALDIYENLIAEEEILLANKEWYNYAHKTSQMMGDYKKAYTYSLKTNAIQDSLSQQKKMQQTHYLKIKFDAVQKEKTNQTLKAAVLQEKTQIKFLYAIASIFLLSIIILFGAFFQKRKYNNKLKEEVRNRTQELEEANYKLKLSNKEMDEFNRILSHDLKEPLRSIVGFGALAERELESGTTAQEYLSFIVKSGKQLNQLIDDVSKFQKTNEKSDLNQVYFDSNQMMDSIVRSIHLLIHKKNVRITYQDLPQVYTFQSFLFLVFKNLIENGIKYNKSEHPTIQIRHRNENNFHYFEIEDNGIGIDPLYHEKVFGMFQRLNDKSSYEGTGLGLSMARKMMKKMNGRISILRSEEGKGSIFQISFPNITKKVPDYSMTESEAN